jgi:ribosome-binding factor A
MRSVPTLAFTLDRGLEHARKIDALLDQLHRESLD